MGSSETVTFPSPTSVLITNLVLGQIKYFKITAVNDNGESILENSNSVSVTPSESPSSSYNKKHTDHGDYKLDQSLSGTRAQVYHNPHKNHTIVTHKGTDSIHDWITDLRLGLGHSLGSKLAEEAAKNGHSEVITLNNPTVLNDLVRKKPSNQHDIRTTMDPVSMLKNIAPKKNDITIKSKTINPLIEHSTDVLNRLNQEDEIGGMLCQNNTAVVPEFSSIGMNETSSTSTRRKPKSTRSNHKNTMTMQDLLIELNDPNQTSQGVVRIFKSLTSNERAEEQIATLLIDRYKELLNSGRGLHRGGGCTHSKSEVTKIEKLRDSLRGFYLNAIANVEPEDHRTRINNLMEYLMNEPISESNAEIIEEENIVALINHLQFYLPKTNPPDVKGIGKPVKTKKAKVIGIEMDFDRTWVHQNHDFCIYCILLAKILNKLVVARISKVKDTISIVTTLGLDFIYPLPQHPHHPLH
eukprot:gene11102-14899_t